MAEAARIPEQTSHPLAPLEAAEVERAAALVKPHVREGAAFCSVALVDPPKDAANEADAPRRLRLIGYDYPTGDVPDGGFDALVDLSSGSVSVERIVEG